MLVVGLTGGICSGKSTVARMFEKLGAIVLDADQMVHELEKPGGPIYEKIVTAFGQEILDKKGEIDRAKLGALVFNNPQRRKELEGIVHPALAARMAEERSRLSQSGKVKVLIVDAALLIETGFFRNFDRVVLVTCPEETQVQRLQQKGGLSREEAMARLRAQMPLKDKIPYAHYLIDNSGSLKATESQAKRVYQQLLARPKLRLGRAQ